jgi:two-component system NarL family response regulator
LHEVSSEIIRILHVDEHALLRDLLAAQVENTPGLELLGSAKNAEEALQIVETKSPDMVLMEARMPPGGMTSVELAQSLCDSDPGIKVIVLSAYVYPAYVHDLNRAGVKGYLLKSETWAEVLRAIRAIHGGAFVASPSVAQTLLSGRDSAERGSMLSVAESKLMGMVAEGLSNNEIAEQMHISESTVRSRIGKTLAKLGASSRTKAVTEAIKRGFVVVN